MNCSLIMHARGYELTNIDLLSSLLTLGSGSPYALRHWELSNLSEGLVRWQHRTIGLIEFTPILGALVALIERVAVWVFLKNDLAVAINENRPNFYQRLVDLDGIPLWLHGDRILSRYTCAISLCPIRHPVRDPNARVLYERVNILRWIQQSGTSPATRLPLSEDQLIPLPAIKSLIECRLGQLDQLIQNAVEVRDLRE